LPFLFYLSFPENISRPSLIIPSINLH